MPSLLGRLPIIAAPLPDGARQADEGGPAAAFARSPDNGLGLLVVGHGTADPVGAEETREVTRLVAALLPGVPVGLGFLEVIGPSIGESLERLARLGCRQLIAAPLLLFTAGHARRDVPEALSQAARRLGVAVRQSQAFGCHPEIVAQSRQRRCEALQSLEPLSADETVLAMIGRGSSDPEAVRQLGVFAEATRATGEHAMRRDDSCGRIELGFVAAARPTVAEALRAAARGARRVIVQPHLLFHGHVEEQVEAALGEARAEHQAVEWVRVERLGATQRVARAVVALAADAARAT
jgi:sirohydrochlorin cobaltochelatase